MELNITKQTAKAPSLFGMSACGHATTMTGTTGLPTAMSVVRNRQAIVKGDMGLAVPAYFLGTSAWRPPTS